MPQIIVQVARGEGDGAVMLQERLSCHDLDSDHFAGQLVERIGWALLDAEDVEGRVEAQARRTANGAQAEALKGLSGGR